MLEEMTAEEFEGWLIKDRVEPIGQATHMVSLLAWMVHAYLAGPEASSMESFLPWMKHLPAAKSGQKEAQDHLKMMAEGMLNNGGLG